jgi:hypothetical protein
LEDILKPRKAIATVALGAHVEFLELSFENLKLYAEKHGYELEICRENLDPNRPECWTKTLFILRLMNDYDEIFWIDSDAIIVDSTTDIRDELLPETELAWVYHAYDNQSHPNAGIMYIKVNSETKDFFQTVNAQEDLYFHPWWDQAAMMRVLGQDSVVHPIGSGNIVHPFKIQEQRISNEWNSIRQDAAPHVRIRHLAGDSTLIRKLFLSEYANPRGKSLEQLNLSLLAISDSEREIGLLKIQLDAMVNSRTWKTFSFWRRIRRLGS